MAPMLTCCRQSAHGAPCLRGQAGNAQTDLVTLAMAAWAAHGRKGNAKRPPGWWLRLSELYVLMSFRCSRFHDSAAPAGLRNGKARKESVGANRRVTPGIICKRSTRCHPSGPPSCSSTGCCSNGCCTHPLTCTACISSSLG